MGLAYNPKNRTVTTKYVVATTGDNWFQPTTGFGDNANSGTKAQRLAQCQVVVGTGGTDGLQTVATEQLG